MPARRQYGVTAHPGHPLGTGRRALSNHQRHAEAPRSAGADRVENRLQTVKIAGCKRHPSQNCTGDGSMKVKRTEHEDEDSNAANDDNGSADQQKIEEVVEEDDVCPICQLLLCRPVKTMCKHTLCRACMATWADVSLINPVAVFRVTEVAPSADFEAVNDLEANCPMCRTHTTASPDQARTRKLMSRYPQTYAEREIEEEQFQQQQHQHHDRSLGSGAGSSEGIQTISINIGNTHQEAAVEQRPNRDRRENAGSPDSNHNRHEWSFFVRPSRTDIIEEVQIFLHPTFRPAHIIRQRPPYEIRRIGWGVFTIVAAVILKPGYSWLSEEAEDSPDGAPQGMLRLEWMLDFSSFGGTGAMGRRRLKVKNDRNWQHVSEEDERDTRDFHRMIRQYQRDGRYQPPTLPPQLYEE